MEGESSHHTIHEEWMWDEDEIFDITTMVSCINSLKNTMHLVLDQINKMIGKKGKEPAKFEEIHIDAEM